ncbi:MAG: gluconokinase [Rhodobacteraceae bacterium]|nr:gluconokinase [Paracoccaceae bacterium]
MTPRIVVMGVSGAGKSVIGAALAARIGARFVDADSLHTPEAVAKMAGGTPLDDADRAPWLARVGRALAEAPHPVVIACSALRRRYRDAIRAAAGGPVLFLHLDGPREVIAGRLAARRGHYMPAALLDSQIAALEPPGPDEDHAVLDLRQDPGAIVAAAVAAAAGG